MTKPGRIFIVVLIVTPYDPLDCHRKEPTKLSP